jgi:hypothetical protein
MFALTKGMGLMEDVMVLYIILTDNVASRVVWEMILIIE